MTRRALISRLQDGALAVALAGMALAEIWIPFESVQGEGSSGLASVLAVGTCGLLAFRRVRPLPCILGVVVVWPLVFSIEQIPLLFWGQFVPFLVAVYSVARHGQGRRGLYGAAAAAGLLIFMDFRIDLLSSPQEMLFHWTVTTLTWSAGWGLRSMERHAAASARRAAEVELQSRTRALTAIAEERARIARELHDIVAHSVSVMVVQAGAAEQVVDENPAFVRSALGSIRTTGAGALGEMRRVVSMLREPGTADDIELPAPQPGIAALPDLVAAARATGLDVDLSMGTDTGQLPVGVELAAYRIVQEALTNVRRHAGASSAQVVVRSSAEGLEIEVSDDGRGAAAGRQNGHGLIGMRERAELYGGTLEAENMPNAGFRVRAVLPTGAAT